MDIKLVIVESPGKCGKLRKILGDGYEVVASVGHIMEIPPRGLGIDVKNGFAPSKEISDDRKEVVKTIKSKASKAKEIIIATDPDREGEGIANDIFNLFNKEDQKKCSRITFNEITKSAVLKALDNKREIDMALVDAQKARQVLDRLIGYKISPLLWKDVANKTSAGRVQSVALKIICEREKEIKNFKSEPFWYLDADLKSKNGDFIARTVTDNKDNRFLSEDEVDKAHSLLKNAKYTVGNVEKAEKSVEPYPPFDTASLQTTASSVLGWPVKKTTKIAQELYDSGRVSYIRTDSYNISEEAMKACKDFISKNFDKQYSISSPNVYKKKETSGAQEAHECIRPTHIEDTGDDIDGDESRLYQLIRDRFIACQMAPALVSNTTFSIDTDTKYKLISKGQVIKFDGWMKAYKYSVAKEEVLPSVEKNEKLELKDIEKSKHETQPPPRYNGGSLVKRMEKDGVGRPSTYSSILEGIKARGYIEEIKAKKGAYQATELGLKVYEFLQSRFNDFIMDIGFTAELENSLDTIAEGKNKFISVVSGTYDTMMKKIGDTNVFKDSSGGTGAKCTVCNQGNIVQRRGKMGFFFGCDKYPDCKSIFVKNDDGTFKLKERSFTRTDEKCPVCEKNKREGYLVCRKSIHGEFYGCSNYPKCKVVFIKDEEGNFKQKS